MEDIDGGQNVRLTIVSVGVCIRDGDNERGGSLNIPLNKGARGLEGELNVHRGRRGPVCGVEVIVDGTSKVAEGLKPVCDRIWGVDAPERGSCSRSDGEVSKVVSKVGDFADGLNVTLGQKAVVFDSVGETNESLSQSSLKERRSTDGILEATESQIFSTSAEHKDRKRSRGSRRIRGDHVGRLVHGNKSVRLVVVVVVGSGRKVEVGESASPRYDTYEGRRARDFQDSEPIRLRIGHRSGGGISDNEPHARH